jgi:type I restriction enzyme S subunit
VSGLRASGIAWVGDIPSDWATPPLFARYDVALGKMLNPEAAGGPHQRPYLGNQHVQWDRVRVDDLPTMSVAPNELDRYRVRPGDLLVCEGGEIGRTAVWRGELAECCFQKAVHRLRPRHREDAPRFMYYAMVAAAWRGAFDAEGNRSTIIHLTGEKLRRQRFPVPPGAQQRRIADFLDRKTAVIDELIAKKERLVALLAEKRQALITDRVTSGVGGRTGWVKTRLAWVLSETQRPVIVEPSAQYAEIGVRSHGRGTFHKDPVFGWELDEKKVYWLEPGDLVFNIVFAWERAVAVVQEADRGRIASHRFPTYRAVKGAAEMRFLRYFFVSDLGRFLLDQNSPGAAGRNRTLDRWALLKEEVWMPPVAEQRALADELDTKLAALDSAVTTLEEQRERLREYRQGLITAAVTGQLDVSDERVVAAHDQRVEALR